MTASLLPSDDDAAAFGDRVMADLVKTFSQVGTWAAQNAAESFLVSAGFSIGHSQRGSPRGILFGDFDIQKWRNLSKQDVAELHGTMTGDGREGPIEVRIFERAPQRAKRWFHRLAVNMAAEPPCHNEGITQVRTDGGCLKCDAGEGEECR